jgi:hypothetical protein
MTDNALHRKCVAPEQKFKRKTHARRRRKKEARLHELVDTVDGWPFRRGRRTGGLLFHHSDGRAGLDSMEPDESADIQRRMCKPFCRESGK